MGRLNLDDDNYINLPDNNGMMRTKQIHQDIDTMHSTIKAMVISVLVIICLVCLGIFYIFKPIVVKPDDYVQQQRKIQDKVNQIKKDTLCPTVPAIDCANVDRLGVIPR